MGKQVISNAGDKVKLTFTSKDPRIPSGGQGDILPMLLRFEAPPDAKKHVPVDLVALLDVSNTMNDSAAPAPEKTTKLDVLKKAMRFVIKHLHEDDGLAIVPFNGKILSDYGTELFRISGQRAAAENKVNKLVAKGDTAFSAALEQAAKILDERSDKNRVGVVMLLTDGLDSQKEAMFPIRPEVLKKYPVHTFGIGTKNPNVLLSIAQQSCGTYSFVDGNNLANIADPFAVLLGGLSTIVAVDVSVQLRFYYGGWRSAVKRVSCGFESSEITQPPRGDSWTVSYIKIGMLYAGEVKNFIARVQIEPDWSGSRPWVEPYIEYKDAPGGSTINGDGHNVALYTGKQAGDAGENSRKVRAQIVQFSALEFLSTLQTEFKKKVQGAKDADAAQVEAGSSLESRWEEFMETMDDDLKDDLDLEDLQNEVTEMVSQLKSGAGMAYMCSWVSSQQMQRATTLGSTEAVGTQFFTRAMYDMLKESEKYHLKFSQAQGGGGGGGGKIQKRMDDWEDLKSRAEKLLDQPNQKSLAQTWQELKAAMDKAKKSDVDEAKNRGET